MFTLRMMLIFFGSLGMVVFFTACPPTYPQCESDAHCQEKGEVCVQGMCKECATSKNCKEGFVCEANKCVPKPECRVNEDCGADQQCTMGKCVEMPKADCTSDEDCPTGERCQEGRCMIAQQSEVPTCAFAAVHFDFDEYILTSDAQSKLTEYAECIKQGNLRFMLEGHADERGTEEYNMVLSQKRAASVRTYLTNLGCSSASLDTVGYGENSPKMAGSYEKAWAANRRVEFRQQ